MIIANIVIPLVSFLLALVWMIMRGEKARKEYERCHASEKEMQALQERMKAKAEEEDKLIQQFAQQSEAATGLAKQLLGPGQKKQTDIPAPGRMIQ